MSKGIERWRAVVGYEGLYEVSDHGRVRSIDRIVVGDFAGGMRRYRGKILTATTKPSGHQYVTLSRDGHQQNFHVHGLVAAAFIGPCPKGQEVRHEDGNPQVNWVGNLEYGTRSENMHDSVRHGTHFLAARTACNYGHLFAGPNLVYYTRYKRPGNRTATTVRICVACRWAQARARYVRGEFDVRAAADQRYRQLMVNESQLLLAHG